jgi:hypothetical protein
VVGFGIGGAIAAMGARWQSANEFSRSNYASIKNRRHYLIQKVSANSRTFSVFLGVYRYLMFPLVNDKQGCSLGEGPIGLVLASTKFI